MRARLSTRRNALRAVLAVIVVGLLAIGLLTNAASARRHAPPLPIRMLSGQPTTLSDLHGHPAVIVFWASWCPGCRDEARAVERFARSRAGRGRVVAVDYSDGGNWRAFLRDYGWSFPVFADPDGTLGDSFRIHSLPSTVFLDADGRIASTSPTPQTATSLASGLSGAA
jgi:thiol-disulfide isomerase/thioredoxin